MATTELQTTRERILRFQQAALAVDGHRDPNEVCPVKHHFAPGLYAREIFIPKGSYVVGKTHRYAHLTTVSKGRILVASEFGNLEVVAPSTFMSKPGIKRVGVALEDTIWTTYHPTSETDLAAIEADVIVPEALAYEEPEKLA